MRYWALAVCMALAAVCVFVGFGLAADRLASSEPADAPGGPEWLQTMQKP